MNNFLFIKGLKKNNNQPCYAQTAAQGLLGGREVGEVAGSEGEKCGDGRSLHLGWRAHNTTQHDTTQHTRDVLVGQTVHLFFYPVSGSNRA